LRRRKDAYWRPPRASCAASSAERRRTRWCAREVVCAESNSRRERLENGLRGGAKAADLTVFNRRGPKPAMAERDRKRSAKTRKARHCVFRYLKIQASQTRLGASCQTCRQRPGSDYQSSKKGRSRRVWPRGMGRENYRRYP